MRSFHRSDWLSDFLYDVIFTALGGEYKKSNKQTKWLPAAGLQMFPTRKFRKLKLVQSLSQRKMKPSMASNFLKVSKPLSL